MGKLTDKFWSAAVHVVVALLSAAILRDSLKTIIPLAIFILLLGGLAQFRLAESWPVKHLSWTKLVWIWFFLSLLTSILIRSLYHLSVESEFVIADSIVSAIVFGSLLALLLLLPRSEPWSHIFPRVVYAQTASCFPFLVRDNCVTLYLIKNPNFEWWLPPGGHVELCDNEFPPEVAREKCETEASLTVKSFLNIKNIEIKAADCKSYEAAPLTFALSVPKTAKCAENKHHAFHYDHCFVAIVEEAPTCIGSLERMAVDLSLDYSQKEIVTALNAAVIKHSSRVQGEYPDDLPMRILSALAILSFHIGPQPCAT